MLSQNATLELAFTNMLIEKAVLGRKAAERFLRPIRIKAASRS